MFLIEFDSILKLSAGWYFLHAINCVEFKIYDIINNFFGTTITVAGLITGTDIVAQVKDAPKNIIIPATMLREFTTTFLDGMTVEGLENKLNAKIHVSQGGASLVKIVGEIVKWRDYH